MALVHWFGEGLMLLSICFDSLLFGLCICVFGCELIVGDLNKCNFCFTSKKDKKERKGKNHVKKKETRKKERKISKEKKSE